MGGRGVGEGGGQVKGEERVEGVSRKLEAG